MNERRTRMHEYRVHGMSSPYFQKNRAWVATVDDPTVIKSEMCYRFWLDHQHDTVDAAGVMKLPIFCHWTVLRGEDVETPLPPGTLIKPHYHSRAQERVRKVLKCIRREVCLCYQDPSYQHGPEQAGTCPWVDEHIDIDVYVVYSLTLCDQGAILKDATKSPSPSGWVNNLTWVDGRLRSTSSPARARACVATSPQSSTTTRGAMDSATRPKPKSRRTTSTMAYSRAMPAIKWRATNSRPGVQSWFSAELAM
jgi:hypothetical protein